MSGSGVYIVYTKYPEWIVERNLTKAQAISLVAELNKIKSMYFYKKIP